MTNKVECAESEEQPRNDVSGPFTLSSEQEAVAEQLIMQEEIPGAKTEQEAALDQMETSLEIGLTESCQSAGPVSADLLEPFLRAEQKEIEQKASQSGVDLGVDEKPTEPEAQST